MRGPNETQFIPHLATIPPPVDVCSANVCGPYSICHEVNQHPVCSCQSGYIGMPPNCRAECLTNSDCPQDKACIQQKCANPCSPGPCADRAICKVVNHNPICSCPSGFTGDPFVRCIFRERKPASNSFGSIVKSFRFSQAWIQFCKTLFEI